MSTARPVPTRLITRAAAVTGAAGLMTLGLAATASAHVGVTPSDTAAGSYSILTFSVPHGCDGSPTTRLAIQVPEGINTVTPSRNPFYDVSEKIDQLAEPIEGSHGEEITERTSVVTYTATTPLPDGQRDTLELSVQLPEDAEGQTLAFPVIQTCEKGETAWTQIAAEGQTEDDLEDPAPTVTVTAAGEGDHHDAAASGDEAAEGAEGTEGDDAAQVSATTDTTAATSAVSSDDDGNGLAIAGLATGVVGIVVAAVALARTRRTAA